MKTFAAVINKHKASKHQIPPGQGWKTRQQVARELGVNPRDLRDHLADAITAKDIEEKKFSEWDAAKPACATKATAPPTSPIDAAGPTSPAFTLPPSEPYLTRSPYN